MVDRLFLFLSINSYNSLLMMMVITLRAMHMLTLLLSLIQTMAKELLNDGIQLIVLLTPCHHDVNLGPQMGEQGIGSVPKTVDGLRLAYLLKAIQQTRYKLSVLPFIIINHM